MTLHRIPLPIGEGLGVGERCSAPRPRPPQLLRRIDRSATTAERIEHHVAGVGRGGDDPFEEGTRFLGGVAEDFLRPIVNNWNVVPKILDWHPRHLV